MAATIKKKLVVVGDPLCGKTAVLSVFRGKEFPEQNVPIVIDNYIANIEVNGQIIELQIFDTAGSSNHEKLRLNSYSDSDVILICYDIAYPDSMESVQPKWAPEVKHFCPDVPIILVGNKKDLRDIKPVPVKPEEGCAMAMKIDASAFFECSAKNNEGVKEIFEKAARAALQERKVKKQSMVPREDRFLAKSKHEFCSAFESSSNSSKTTLQGKKKKSKQYMFR